MSSIISLKAETEEAMAGTASHWAMAYALTDIPVGRNIMDMLGESAPNGVILDEEMLECAQICIDDVLKTGNGSSQILQIEKHMEIPGIHSACHGTPDIWFFNGTINLWDYKFGHKSIPANSWQNVSYIKGILDQLGVNDQTTKVVMKIVQPRAFNPEGPIKTVTCMASDLRARFNILSMQAEKAHSPDPGVISGPHCRYCPARHSCPAAREAASSAVEYATSAIPDVMTVEALSFEIALLERSIKAIEHRYVAIKALALSEIENGRLIPGYTRENSLGHSRFNASVEEVTALGDLLGLNLIDKPKLVSPAEAKRQLKAMNKKRKTDGQDLIDETVINDYIERPSLGMKLISSDQSKVIKAFKEN